MYDEGLADARAANPFRLPRLHPGIGSVSADPASAHAPAPNSLPKSVTVRLPLVVRSEGPGSLGADDQLANLQAVREGTRVFSAYEAAGRHSHLDHHPKRIAR
jgi:hypothetical protein